MVRVLCWHRYISSTFPSFVKALETMPAFARFIFGKRVCSVGGWYVVCSICTLWRTESKALVPGRLSLLFDWTGHKMLLFVLSNLKKEPKNPRFARIVMSNST